MLALVPGCTVVRIDNAVCDVRVNLFYVLVESCRSPQEEP